MTLEGSSRLIFPLATSAVDVSLGASHTLRLGLHSNRVTPVGHPPHATMLEVLGQVGASSSVMVETAVLLAPPGDVAVGPLVLAAFGHSADAHTRNKDVETIAGDVNTIVDDLVEERIDFARFGSGELGDEAGALVLRLGGACHGSKPVAHFRVDRVRPGLLAATLKFIAATESGYEWLCGYTVYAKIGPSRIKQL